MVAAVHLPAGDSLHPPTQQIFGRVGPGNRQTADYSTAEDGDAVAEEVRERDSGHRSAHYSTVVDAGSGRSGLPRGGRRIFRWRGINCGAGTLLRQQAKGGLSAGWSLAGRHRRKFAERLEVDSQLQSGGGQSGVLRQNAG